MTKTEVLKQRKELLRLLEQWTRAEIMARFGRFDNLEFGDYAMVQIEKVDEIRRLVFGTDNLPALGTRWKMLKEAKVGMKIRKKKKKKTIILGDERNG